MGQPVPDLSVELLHLREADERIFRAEEQIEQQRDSVANQEKDGHDTGTGRELLDLMNRVLAVMQEHRRLILDTLQELSARGDGGMH